MGDGLFGTDGVRGRANSYPMTAEIALKLGAASRVLVFGTEGATDPGLYRELVGRSPEIVQDDAAR